MSPGLRAGAFESARRARQVWRARFVIPRLRRGDLPGVRPADGRSGFTTGLAALGSGMQRRPRRWRQATVNDGGLLRQAVRHALPFRRCRLPCRCDAAVRSFWSSRGGYFGVRVRAGPCRNAVASSGYQAHASFARTGPRPRPCICRESWRGHGGAALRFVSPRASSPQPCGPTNFPSAAQIPREANFSCLPVLRCAAAPASPGVRRARPRAVRITPRPRPARTWINLERTSS